MICPACNASSEFRFSAIYVKCQDCATIYAARDIADLVKTENDEPEPRNTPELMQVRLNRILSVYHRLIMIADIGCGTGAFCNFLQQSGYLVTGVDQNTEVKLSGLISQCYDVCFAIEVIEHFSNPKELIDGAMRALRPGGMLYIETTFADSIPDCNFHPYLNPEIGHRTILSKKGLEILCGDYKTMWLNDNVVLIVKESL